MHKGCGFFVKYFKKGATLQLYFHTRLVKVTSLGIISLLVKTTIGVLNKQTSPSYFMQALQVPPPNNSFSISSDPGSKLGSFHNKILFCIASCNGNRLYLLKLPICPKLIQECITQSKKYFFPEHDGPMMQNTILFGNLFVN